MPPQQDQQGGGSSALLSSPSSSPNDDDDNNLQEPLLGDGHTGQDSRQRRPPDSTTTIIDPDIVLPVPTSWWWCCRWCCRDDNDNNNVNNPTTKTIRVNHNVLLNLIVAVLYGISSSLWNGTAYAAYLKKLGNGKNGPLGDIEAVSGLASLITALPIGYIADTIGRSKVIRTGGTLLLITSILQIGVLEWVGTNDEGGGGSNDNNNTITNITNYSYYDDHGDHDYDEEEYYYVGGESGNLFWLSSWIGGGRNTNNDGNNNNMLLSSLFLYGQGPHSTSTALWMCGIIMALWGVGDGVVNGPCMALFADSTPEGQRSSYFTYMFVAFTGASACGPLVSIVLFQTLGDDWDLYHLRIVIYVGLVLEIVTSVVMMFFDDRKALDENSGDDGEDDDDDNDGSNTRGDDDQGGNGTTTGRRRSTEGPDEVFTDEEPLGGGDVPPASTSLRQRQRWVPYIVFAQGLIFAMGSGMTVKFFPLFFKDEVGMSPSQVQIVYVIVPFVMVLASTLCTRLAGPVGFGRVQTMLLFSSLGVSMLYAMVFFKSYLDHHPFLLVPVYVLRTSLMNASYPIQESILMDFVPKKERARWKSLDSVASASWCGSAALGGWLADKYDYTYTFLITAVLQTIGILVWCLLLPLVPREEGNREEEDEEEEEEGGEVVVVGPNLDVPSSSSVTQPLLTTSTAADDDHH